MELEQKKLTLDSGKTGWYEYDRDSDLLEIIFRQADATCAVELTESIVLRVDWETDEPLSLSFLSISKLLKPAEYGEVFSNQPIPMTGIKHTPVLMQAA